MLAEVSTSSREERGNRHYRKSVPERLVPLYSLYIAGIVWHFSTYRSWYHLDIGISSPALHLRFRRETCYQQQKFSTNKDLNSKKDTKVLMDMSIASSGVILII